ncbi:MAG: protease inhibitor I42 family protein [Dehalococcoidia bacterium]|jgi:inhibitor of cysteine peptidase
MKKKIIALAAFLVLLLPLFSCIVTSELIEVSVSCEDFTESPNSILNEFEIGVGDKINIRLCYNSSTGFAWEYTMTGDNAVKEEDHDFEEPDGDLVGAAGTEVWTFEGIEAGTAVIEMSYSQPWEGGTKEAWTYKTTITVE